MAESITASSAESDVVDESPVKESAVKSRSQTNESYIDLIKVDKSKRRMYLIKHDVIVHEFRIALGARPKGHKLWEGDQRTPEGTYLLDFVIDDSSFYRSIHINYPNQADTDWAEYKGVNPGGDIKIHGFKNGDNRAQHYVQSFDWTNGCIAITNDEIDTLLSVVRTGTPIFIEW
ncbi:L,D-transpeptidase family protein [Vibrio sp. ZSDE26]|uniref:L,D-transpeptidase family protein n=1 Tax=Vibrio amylolyticus TaxID=2847292 RepID=A0A9X1XIN3_9VIBR|nr:L,D-transpeptidase family protein [Vibrio amylolyticus]MCK6263732.1 L,D-transpeptidase family protein [Vibrio amylolyticus]